MKKLISVEPVEHHKLTGRLPIKIDRDEEGGSIVAKIDARVAAEVVDLADQAMVDAVIRAAKAACVSDLYLMDHLFVLEVIKCLMEQKRAEGVHGDDQDNLYGDTVRRLARIGIKDPTAQITEMAKEIKAYRARIVQMQDYIGHLTEGRNRVPYHEREKVYREAIEVNGSTAQQIVALEELSEAQKEICKLLRSQGSLDHLAEEVADATIVLEQVRLIHGINDQVNKKMDEKVERLRRNLAAARAKKEETG